MRHIAMITGLAATLLLTSGAAEASPKKSQRIVTYPYKQVMPAAVRYLVIDARHKVIAKDWKAGYILFEMKEGRRTFRGALEVVRFVEKRRPMLKLILSIDDRPRYVEAVMLNQLLRKLRKQLGAPPSPAPLPKPAPAPDPAKVTKTANKK